MRKFSNEAVNTGNFCTVTFFTKSGETRTINGRTGVKKYIKGTGKRTNETEQKYLLLWTRNGSNKFDAPCHIARDKIIEFKAHGVKGMRNNGSIYAKTV